MTGVQTCALPILETSTRVARSTAADKNELLYGVAVNSSWFAGYSIRDYLRVNDNAVEESNGGKYLIRIHGDKCYVVLDYIVVMGSSNPEEQTAGSRAHMTLVNEGGKADYVKCRPKTEYDSGTEVEGLGKGTYDQCFFYYDRDDCAITYLVNTEENNPAILGTLSLPYGVILDATKIGRAHV